MATRTGVRHEKNPPLLEMNMPNDVLTSLQGEIAHRHEKVEACRAAYETALAEERSFIKNIANTLKISSKGNASCTKERQARVLELIKQNKSREEVATILNVKVTTVDYDFRALRKQGMLPAVGDQVSQPSANEKRFMELYLDGTSINEIADELGLSRAAADNTLARIRHKGLVPLVSSPDEEARDEVAEIPHDDVSPVESTNVTDDGAESSEKGSSKPELQAEVKRQQGGVSSRCATLPTTTVKKHKHRAKVDRMGDGHTIPDDTGHVHRVYRFVLSVAQNHTHDLVT